MISRILTNSVWVGIPIALFLIVSIAVLFYVTWCSSGSKSYH